MHALLNLTVEQSLFSTTFKYVPQGMLPIADKPIAAYQIDQLVYLGIKHITVITTNNTQHTSQKLGDGSFWSVNIGYLNYDNPSDFKAYQYLKKQGVMEVLADKPIKQNNQHSLKYNSIYDQFIDDNIWVLKHTEQFQLSSYQARPNIYLAEGAKTKTASDYPIHLGKYSQLKNQCILRGPSVIGKNTIVETGTVLDNTVIMPNTHIGKHLDLSNCLVTAEWIYHRVTKQKIPINEPEILAVA